MTAAAPIPTVMVDLQQSWRQLVTAVGGTIVDLSPARGQRRIDPRQLAGKRDRG